MVYTALPLVSLPRTLKKRHSAGPYEIISNTIYKATCTIYFHSVISANIANIDMKYNQ